MPIIGEVQIKPQAFAAAAAWAAKWVTLKPVVPVHAGLALEVHADRLYIGAFNENVSARAMVDVEVADAEAVAGGKSRAVVSGRLLAELVGTFAGKLVTITGDENSVFLRAGRFSVSLPTLNEGDFPALPTAPPPIGSVSGDALATAVGRVSVAVGRDPAMGTIFSTVFLGFADNHIELLATDRYRAAGVSLPWTVNAGARTAGPDALVLGHVLKDAALGFAGPDEIEIGLSGSAISLTSPTRSLTIQQAVLQQGQEYPLKQFQEYLVTEQERSAVLTVADMLAPLKRAGLVRGKEGPVRLTFSPGEVVVSSKADEIAQEGDEGVDVEYEGEETAIAFNPHYFSDALSTVPAAKVRLGFGSPKKPITLSVDDDPSWHHILVPVLIRK